jgi:hypothetical protein
MTSYQSLILSRHFEQFIETKGPVPCSQEPNTGLYTRQTNPVHITTPYLFKIVTHLCSGLPCSLFPPHFLISPMRAK